MVAGDEQRGGAKDPKTVMDYEHRAAVAKSLRSKSYYDGGNECELEVHQLKCDATSQEAVEKSKVHLVMIQTTSASKAAWDAASCEPDLFDKETFGRLASSVSTFADLQKVVHGNGAELYEFAKQQFASVGAPDWERRKAEAEN